MIDVSILPAISAIDPADWDACGPDVFTAHRFLDALEQSGSTGPGTGWHPQHLVARQDGAIIGVAPAYVKEHSQGEYIFDHTFAHAYERAGGAYYPKLQVAVPFTPATGPRLLTRPGHSPAGLLAATQTLTERHGLSSAHITFCTAAEADASQDAGFLYRQTQQYHWENNGYADFDAFLAALSSRKRKTIRKERATAQAFGGQIQTLTGAQIQPHHWDAMWMFYQDTGARKWGTPYLTRAFFELAHATLRDDILLVLALQDGRYVAGALNVIGGDTLYGRYWGCVAHHPCLHFELCYYQAIDWAIAHGLSRVEAGAQGDHKLARGYMPTATHSLHWFREPQFHEAVAHYLTEERAAMAEEIEVLTQYGPFRKTHASEHD